MNIKQMEYFVAIVNEGSIANAAKSLFISASALSQLVKKMEEEVGAELFIRNKHQLQLSYAGRQLYEYALASTNNFRQLVQSFKDVQDIHSGELILSLSVKRAMSLLPIFLPAFSAKYPDVKLKTIGDMLTVEEREQNLIDGKYDFIINSFHDHRQSNDLEYIKIGTERMILFTGKDTALAQRLVVDGQVPASVSIGEIADEPLLLPAPVYGGRYMVDSMFARIGKRPNILAQVSPVCASRSMVETGHFSTISAEIVKDGKILVVQNPNCYAIPIELSTGFEYEGSRPIYLAYKKSMSLVSFQRDFVHMVVSSLSDEIEEDE